MENYKTKTMTWHEWKQQMKRNPLYRLSEALREQEESIDRDDTYEQHIETEMKSVRRV